MNSKFVLPVIFIAVVFFSCNRNSNSEPAPQGIKTEQVLPEQEQIHVGSDKQNQLADSAIAGHPQKTVAPIDWDKKIIKTATLKFEVKDFKTHATDVYKTVKQYGGYIAAEDQSHGSDKQETTITIKVPVEQFEGMVNQFSGRDVKIIERKISSDDVGTQIIDTKSRLEAKRAMHTKYLQFFKDAKNVEEVLRVQTDINNLQETMESAAGRINYLNQQAAMSTVVLTFFQPIEGTTPNESPSFLTRISEAFNTGGSWLGNVLVGLVSIWPFLLVIALGVFATKKFLSPKTKQPNP